MVQTGGDAPVQQCCDAARGYCRCKGYVYHLCDGVKEDVAGGSAKGRLGTGVKSRAAGNKVNIRVKVIQ